MQQQQMMMKQFSEMMLKQNSPKLDADGKPAKVQRVIIVPVPAYSYGLNSGSHMISGGSASYQEMHEKHHGDHSDTEGEVKDEGKVVEPVK